MGKTILIIEQSEVVRKGLIQIIGSFGLFDSIHELACNANIESSVIRLEPDIVVINPALLKPGLPEWLQENRNGQMKIAAIVYALFDDEIKDLFDEVIQIGYTRLKIKNKLSSLLSRTEETGSPVPDDTLSPREKDVVKLLAKGFSNKEISEQLFISPHTVITHRKNITRKLNIKSVAGLIVYAIINGIVSVEEMQGE
ncbi:MAG: response regulator transcription factor [Bacteroidales bacterium]